MCHSHRIVKATTIVLTAFVYCSQSQIVTYEKLDRWCSLAEGGIDMCKYGSHQEMISRLEKLVTNNAERADIGVIGESVFGKNLTYVKIAGNVKRKRSLGTPMVQFVGNVHGDETLGRQLIIYLAEYLVRNYGKDPRVTLLLDRTEIHLLPSLNPDGFDKSWEGCDIIVRLFRSGKAMTNANGRDLNKDYPKHFHQNQDAPMKNLAIGRQPETVAMMKWLRSEPFVLSANLRGGDVAAVYPYVDSPWSPDLTKGQYSKAPDDAFLKFVAGLYSANHATMHRGDNCGGDKVLDQGIVNGAVWSNTPGTLTDYTYIYTNAMALSLQLSCCKHPASRDLYSEWRANKESLLKFVESAHMGLKGLVLDSSYMPIMNAELVVSGIDKNIRTSPRGEYWRLLVPGTYTVFAKAHGHQPSLPEIVKIPLVWPPMTVVKHFKLYKVEKGETP